VPARIVLTCWGSHGDLFPYLGLGSLLKVDLSDATLVARLLDPARGTAIILRDMLMPALHDAYADLDEAVDGADLLVTHIATYSAPLVADKRRLPWVSTVLAPASLFSVHDFPVVFPPQVARLARLGRWPARALLAMAHLVTHPWAEEVRRLRTELGLRRRPASSFTTGYRTA
jgi:UDP:flavonoid glycosyltransferase YjiC (YdhE family)